MLHRALILALSLGFFCSTVLGAKLGDQIQIFSQAVNNPGPGQGWGYVYTYLVDPTGIEYHETTHLPWITSAGITYSTVTFNVPGTWHLMLGSANQTPFKSPSVDTDTPIQVDLPSASISANPTKAWINQTATLNWRSTGGDGGAVTGPGVNVQNTTGGNTSVQLGQIGLNTFTYISSYGNTYYSTPATAVVDVSDPRLTLQYVYRYVQPAADISGTTSIVVGSSATLTLSQSNNAPTGNILSGPGISQVDPASNVTVTPSAAGLASYTYTVRGYAILNWDFTGAMSATLTTPSGTTPVPLIEVAYPVYIDGQYFASISNGVVSLDFNAYALTMPTVSANHVINVLKASPTVSFVGGDVIVGQPYALSASPTGGYAPTGGFSYSLVSGPGSVTGSTLTGNAAGNSLVVQATYNGDANNNSASSTASFNVVKASPAIAFTGSTIFIGQPIVLGATLSGGFAPSGGISYSFLSGNGSIVGSTLTPTTLGALTIHSTYAGDSNNNPTFTDASFTVIKATPTVNFPPTSTTVGTSLPLIATIQGGFNPTGSLTFGVISGPGSINGSNLITTAVGPVTVRATYPGDADNNSTFSDTTITIQKANPTIAFPGGPVMVGNSTVVNASLVGGFSPTGAIGYQVISGPGTLSGSTLSSTGVGAIVVRATYPGDANNNSSTQDATFVSGKATPTINFPDQQMYTGNSLTLVASLSGGFSPTGAVTLSYVSGPGTLSGNILSPTGPGAIVILASYAGDINNNAANTTATITAIHATPLVTITAPASAYSGSPLTVRSRATTLSNDLTLHSIESQNPVGVWTANIAAANGGLSDRVLGVTFATTGLWHLRAGASTDNGITWTYSLTIPVQVVDGIVQHVVESYAIPKSGMEIWYTNSSVTSKTYRVQLSNP